MGLFNKLRSLRFLGLKEWVIENPASILLVLFLLFIIIFTLQVDIPKAKISHPDIDYSRNEKPEVVIQ